MRRYWRLWTAQTTEDSFVPLERINVRGKGIVTKWDIWTRILPALKDLRIKLPVVVESYFVEDGPGLQHSGKGEIENYFDLLITRYGEIFKIENNQVFERI
jgi:hypothetical protein